MKKKDLSILVVAALAVTAILLFKSQESPVQPRQPTAPPKIDYGPLIRTHADQASRRNANAIRVFELDVDRILKVHKSKMLQAADAAAKEGADYESCCAIVYYLAWDQVRTGSETESYLSGQIDPIIEPVIEAFARDVSSAVDDLNAELRRSTLLLAKDLAALCPSEEREAIDVSVDDHQAELDGALRNLGFNSAGVGVAIAFDAWAISNSRLGQLIWEKIKSIAARLFGKQVTKVGASAAVAAADGPLPVGDILAIGGIIWTGYDIYAGRKQFEQELRIALANMFGESNRDIHQQAINHAGRMLKHYQQLQDDIGTQTAAKLSTP